MKNHYLLTTVLLLPCITTTLAVKAINDTEKYPVCVSDSDCEQKNLIGHACFQYFCYPWQDKATEVRHFRFFFTYFHLDKIKDRRHF